MFSVLEVNAQRIRKNRVNNSFICESDKGGKLGKSTGLDWKMGSRNGHWAGNGNLILGTGKWAGKWKCPYWASTAVYTVETTFFAA